MQTIRALSRVVSTLPPPPLQVVCPGPGERSFHIFYQILDGASSAEKSALGLASAEHFTLLTGGGRCLTRGVKSTSDRIEFSQA